MCFRQPFVHFLQKIAQFFSCFTKISTILVIYNIHYVPIFKILYNKIVIQEYYDAQNDEFENKCLNFHKNDIYWLFIIVFSKYRNLWQISVSKNFLFHLNYKKTTFLSMFSTLITIQGYEHAFKTNLFSFGPINVVSTHKVFSVM